MVLVSETSFFLLSSNRLWRGTSLFANEREDQWALAYRPPSSPSSEFPHCCTKYRDHSCYNIALRLCVGGRDQVTWLGGSDGRRAVVEVEVIMVVVLLVVADSLNGANSFHRGGLRMIPWYGGVNITGGKSCHVSSARCP